MAKKLPSHLHTIDNKKTGLHLHNLLKDRGLSVKDVQSYLGLSCPQGIYRWLDGRALSSIDNLYALQGLLDISVEQLLCGSYIPPNKRLLLRSITYQRITSAYAAANALLPEFYGHSL